jgi:hypothetical protein
MLSGGRPGAWHTEPYAKRHAGLITCEIGGSKCHSIEEVRGDRLYSEGQSPTYPGTRDYILTTV